jgi:hypothetical protein
VHRVAKRPPAPVRVWATALGQAATAARLQVDKGEMVRLAGLLALAGDPFTAVPTFHAFKLLFIHPLRINNWKAGLQALPATHASISRVVACVAACQADPVVEQQGFKKTHVNLEQVLPVMAQVPDPAAYLATTRELRKINAIFHPNSLAQAKKSMRGALGDLAPQHSANGDMSKVRQF